MAADQRWQNPVAAKASGSSGDFPIHILPTVYSKAVPPPPPSYATGGASSSSMPPAVLPVKAVPVKSPARAPPTHVIEEAERVNRARGV